MREKSGFEDSVELCIELAQELEARYVDVRAERCYDERLSVINGSVQFASVSERTGVSVRALTDGPWGFCATTDISKKSLKKCVRNAINHSKKNVHIGRKVELAPVRTYEDSYTAAEKRPLEKITIDEKMADIDEWETLLRVSHEIRSTSVCYCGIKSWKLFGSSENTRIWSEKGICWADLKALAKTPFGSKSFSERVGGSSGFDKLNEAAIKRAGKIGSRAVELCKASKASNVKNATIILSPNFSGLLCHEVCGHPSEGDRILGRERVRAGTSWWLGNLGEQLGSEQVTAVDDPTIEGELGYYLYDDEGAKAKPKLLVKNGYINEFMNSRETAAIFSAEPNASMRALGFDYLPLVRMSNTFFKPGDWSRDEIIQDTKRGYLLGPGVTPSIDSRRFAWTIGSPYAYEIRNGEISKPVVDIAAFSTAPDFLKTVDAVSKEWELFPLPGCGKGEPKQPMPSSLGGPYMRGKASVMKLE